MNQLTEPAHAPYSPSSAARWIACPGSVKATEALAATGSEHNVYTASGSVIHAIGEELLQLAFNGESSAVINAAIDQALTRNWGYFCDLPPEFAILEVTSDMVDQAELYLNHARTLTNDDDDVYIEVKMKSWHPNLFGTCDLAALNEERLLICDLKTGAGNMVSPEDNKQLLTYGVLLLHHMAMEDLENDFPVTLAISQPPDENNPLKEWETTVGKLRSHAADIIAAMDEDHLAAGEHCKWCPVRASCSELHNMAINAASLDLDGLSPTEWAAALELSAILKPWCEAVYGRASQLAKEEGLNVPGYKLVQKKGRTTWLSDKEASYAIVEKLDEKGVALENSPKIFNEPALRTPTQLKKELKGVLDDVAFIDELTHTPDRGIILVKASDKREEIESGENLIKAAEQVALFNS